MIWPPLTICLYGPDFELSLLYNGVRFAVYVREYEREKDGEVNTELTYDESPQWVYNPAYVGTVCLFCVGIRYTR